MRFLLVSFWASVCLVAARTNVKSLTESMGQEVIEIGSPIKDLPGDIEEEPSAEIDDINDLTTINVPKVSSPPVTKKKYPPNYSETRRRIKDIDIIDGGKDDEEMKIEKELADLYKDNADYKMESGESTTLPPTTWPPTTWPSTTWPTTTFSANNSPAKPVERQRPGEFSFQPKSDSIKDIEAFRTSIDQISCQKNQKLDDYISTPSTNSENTEKSGAKGTFAKGLFLVIVLSVTNLFN